MLKGDFPIARFAGLRTPFYYYDMELLGRTLSAIKQEMGRLPGSHMHYAVKANFNPRILKVIAAAGFGADCVSGGEVRAALEAGFPPEKIVFAGVGKSDEEIILGLEKGISRFNVESAAELAVINELALCRGVVAPVSIRVNPDIGAHTHANITTGLAENKFGVNLEQLDDVMRLALGLPGVEYRGLHFHIGSQIMDMSDFQALCNRINNIQADFERKGYPLGDINVGGGLGINYEHPNHLPMADFGAYFGTFRKHLQRRHGQQLHFELGRAVVAPCGSLICRVLYVKEGTHKRFAIVDGSMTELIRPALYHAYHRIENLGSPSDRVAPSLAGCDRREPGGLVEPSLAVSDRREPGGLVEPLLAVSDRREPGGVTGAEPPSKGDNGAAVTGAEPPSKVVDQHELVYDVVGPVCESSDVFAKGISLPACRRGDFIAIRSAGAYGESMASRYNCHELPGSYFDDK